MNWIAKRLLEPSTHGGLSIFTLILTGLLPTQWQPVAGPIGEAVAAVFATAAVALSEKKADPK